MGLKVFHHLSMKAGSEDFTVTVATLQEYTMQNWFLSRARLAVKLTALLSLQIFQIATINY
jgi:hypothetical protein